MAEAVGVASGVLTLAVFAFQSSVKLYQTVGSFNSHQQRVKDLVEELSALSGVLSTLAETIKGMTGVDFSALDLPLKRCGDACKDFEGELLKSSSRSGGNRTSFRDWAKLRYMREDIDGFRRLLAGYKMTVTIALIDANLRQSSATAENAETYNDILETAKADLEDRLERIDGKLDSIVQQNISRSGSETHELELIKEERLSTEKCLQICAQLSDHISQIQEAAKQKQNEDGSTDPASLPHRIAHEGLEECKSSLARTALQLESYEKQLFTRMTSKLKTSISSDEARADLERLRDEWEATRQGMLICTKAQDHLKTDITMIDNYATGDAVQFMVSTNNKIIHGKNRGVGWKTRQVGGHLSDESVQQIARTLGTITIPSAEQAVPRPASPPQRETTSVPSKQPEDRSDPNFKGRYGRGFSL
ncbi:hypothetical protein K431DRAFT_258517, partial [Polychaeton citri CBS 116435]